MNDNKSIVEGNHAIAIFNGVKFVEGNLTHSCDKHQYLLADEGCTCYKKYNAYLINDRRLSAEDLKYHTSWDWLMPVVEKINATNGELHNVNIDSSRTFLHINSDFKIPMQTFINEQYGSKIAATWQAVVQFIQWYNEKLNSDQNDKRSVATDVDSSNQVD